MDKVVILFKGGVETQEYFSIEMSKTFQKHGYEIYWFDLVLSGLSAKQLCDFYKADKSKKFMAFTFNFNGIAGEDGLYDESFDGSRVRAVGRELGFFRKGRIRHGKRPKHFICRNVMAAVK